MAGGALVVEEFCSALQCGVGALWGKRAGMEWGVWGVWGGGRGVEGSQSCAWSRQPCREVLLSPLGRDASRPARVSISAGAMD